MKIKFTEHKFSKSNNSRTKWPPSAQNKTQVYGKEQINMSITPIPFALF